MYHSIARKWSRRAAAWLLAAVGFLATLGGFAADAQIAFKIPKYLDVLSVPATLDGTEHLCVIDSGCSFNTFHSPLRKKLGTPLGQGSVTTASSEELGVEYFSAPTARLGDLDLERETPVLCVDLTSPREATGRDIEGLLGMPLFQATTIRVDFDQQQLKIWRGPSKPVPEWGQPLHVSYRKSGLPTINVTLGGRIKTQCIVDTGCTGSLILASDVFSNLLDNQLITLIEDAKHVEANGVRSGRNGILSKVKVGDFEHTGLFVSEGGKESSIGLKYLRRFRVTFDFGHDFMYMAKGMTFDIPDKRPVGVGLMRKNGKSVVFDVQRNSAAEKAGIRVGDEVISVAGLPIADKPLFEVYWLIGEKVDSDGRTSLGYLRGGVEQTASVRIPR